MHRMTIRLPAVSFLGVTEGDAVINVGVSGPGVVKKALNRCEVKGFESQR